MPSEHLVNFSCHRIMPFIPEGSAPALPSGRKGTHACGTGVQVRLWPQPAHQIVLRHGTAFSVGEQVLEDGQSPDVAPQIYYLLTVAQELEAAEEMDAQIGTCSNRWCFRTVV